MILANVAFGTLLINYIKKPKVVVMRKCEEMFGEDEDTEIYELTKEEEKAVVAKK